MTETREDGQTENVAVITDIERKVRMPLNSSELDIISHLVDAQDDDDETHFPCYTLKTGVDWDTVDALLWPDK